jgi:hypothetical protein
MPAVHFEGRTLTVIDSDDERAALRAYDSLASGGLLVVHVAESGFHSDLEPILKCHGSTVRPRF